MKNTVNILWTQQDREATVKHYSEFGIALTLIAMFLIPAGLLFSIGWLLLAFPCGYLGGIYLGMAVCFQDNNIYFNLNKPRAEILLGENNDAA